MGNLETKFNFLTAAISDAQEIIKFIDTKAAFATIIIGGMLAIIHSDYQTICNDYCSYCWYIRVLIWTLLSSIFLSIYCLIKVIMPVNKIYCETITPRFYLCTDEKSLLKFFPKKISIQPSIEEYQKQIEDAKEKEILNSLTCELYTVSYIREVKSKRLHNLLLILIITGILFLLSYILIK